MNIKKKDVQIEYQEEGYPNEYQEERRTNRISRRRMSK